MSRFFIDRPVFAWVIAILLMVAGVLSITSLPVAQYPSIAPPSISITATYPGASAETLEATVTQVIEQKLNGLDHLRYIESASQSSGTVTITVTFDVGTNPDTAQVQVQNKVALASTLLPIAVQVQGVVVTKAVKNFLIVIGFVSDDGTLSSADLGDFAVGTIQDPVSRLPGVGDIQSFGTQYAMRVWVDPNKLYQYQITTGDVTAAITAQNMQVTSGSLGGNPSVKGQLLNATIKAQSLLQTPEQFGNILLRVNPDGSRVFLHGQFPTNPPLFPRAGDLGRGGFVSQSQFESSSALKTETKSWSGVLSSSTSSRLTPITRTRPRLLAALQVDGGSDSQGIIICPETLTARITAFRFH